MKSDFSIITIGLSPAWDVVCYGEGLEWGQHKLVTSASPIPAGKAMNISRALAWMGEQSIAAGLWGQDDYQQLLKPLRQWFDRLTIPSRVEGFKGRIKVKMTPAIGRTRLNITIVDAAKRREMHLRNKSELASKRTLRQLKADLMKTVGKNSICVFAGLMPEDSLLKDVIGIIKDCSNRGAKIALDTFGDALREIVDNWHIWLIKPNVAELRQLLDKQVSNTPVSLAKAASGLLDKVEIVLISRGPKGAVVVTGQGAWQARVIDSGKDKIGGSCGDYLLAGFLKSLKNGAGDGFALATAIRVATAKAWGWTENKTWQKVQRKIKVEISGI
jgi:fructose-1-phosphate kinase PfkB-like protein